jgi:hypothetical protein
MATRKYKSDIKNCKISVKLSESDYNKLCDDAKKYDLNVSEYIRELVRSGGKVDISYADDRAKLIRQIVGIATNVNQLTKRANEMEKVYYADILIMQGYLKDVQKSMGEVLKVWQLQKS